MEVENLGFITDAGDDPRSWGQSIGYGDGLRMHFDSQAQRLDVRLDNEQTLFLQQELEAVINKIVESPPLMLSGQQVFNTKQVPTWAESYSWKEMDGSGRMQPVGDNGADDLPEVYVGGLKRTGNVRTYGMAISWSWMDLVRAAQTNTPLNTQQLAYAQRVHDETINDLIWRGNTSIGLTGLLNHPTIGRTTTTTAFDGLTASALRDAVLEPLRAMVTDTSGAERPDTVLLPISQYQEIMLQSQGTADNTLGVMEEIIRKGRGITGNPNFRVVEVRELAGAGDGGSDVMAILNSSSEVVEYTMAMAFNPLPLQVSGLKYRIPILARPGELDVYRPGGIRLVQGI